ncbi:hypothetical protein MTO96_007500 [Rhipicephalus appendiculatus]
MSERGVGGSGEFVIASSVTLSFPSPRSLRNHNQIKGMHSARNTRIRSDPNERRDKNENSGGSENRGDTDREKGEKIGRDSNSARPDVDVVGGQASRREGATPTLLSPSATPQENRRTQRRRVGTEGDLPV